MGLLDLFTGAASERAAKNNASAIQAGLGQSGNALLTSYGNAQNLLLDGADPSALSSLNSGYGQARQDVTGQYGTTQSLLGQQQGLYDHMAAGGQGAYDRYLNATGANGTAGSAQAAQDFSAAPGTQYAMDQALDAVQRTAAARGGLAGGNATADILKTSTGLADQNYNNYVNNLANAASSYGTALSGQSQSLGAQANASQNYGTQLGALGTGLGTAQAGVYGQGAGLQASLGNAYAGNVTNATNALVGNNNNLAQSENAAGANILGGVLGLAGLGSRSAGGSAGSAAGSGASGSGGGGLLGAAGSFISNLFK